MTHTALIVFTVTMVALGLAVGAATKAQRTQTTTRAKPLMTNREQAMYWRLSEAFPASVLLAQVAFSALVTSDRAQRNRYDRKTADFVLCDPSMGVRAVIELDDASHAGRARQDAQRTALLTTAGYRVVRFANVPDIAAIREALAPHTS